MTDEIDQDVREQAFYDAGYSRDDFWRVWCSAWKAAKAAGREQGLREAAEVARTWGERSTTPGDVTIWHAIGIGISKDIEALLSEKSE